MSAPVLILGGYGNFGKRIARALAAQGVPVIIAGRDAARAEALAHNLPLARAAAFDARQSLAEPLERLRPAAVVNSCGPFQTSDYGIARTCIAGGVHYIDLADGRDFVGGIAALDAEARQRNIAVISGASTVPGLSSAVIGHYRREFSVIESLDFGISPGQKTERGLATAQAILTYAGRPFKPVPGDTTRRYGWQDLHRRRYPELGYRWMANCDIPDLDLLPAAYGIRHIRFAAGMECAVPHLGLWLLSWLVRAGVPLNLPRHAAFLLAASRWFDALGTDGGGMHMIIKGRDMSGQPHERRWHIIAREGHGPHIPCVPAIVLARRIAEGNPPVSGAYACVGLVTLGEYMDALKGFSIRQVEG